MGPETALPSGHCLGAQLSPTPQPHQGDQSVPLVPAISQSSKNTRKEGRVVSIDPSCGDAVAHVQRNASFRKPFLTLLQELKKPPFRSTSKKT